MDELTLVAQQKREKETVLPLTRRSGRERETLHAHSLTHTLSHTHCTLPYLLGGGAELCQGAGQVLGALAELHGGGLVADGGHGGLGCSHHLGTRLFAQSQACDLSQ